MNEGERKVIHAQLGSTPVRSFLLVWAMMRKTMNHSPPPFQISRACLMSAYPFEPIEARIILFSDGVNLSFLPFPSLPLVSVDAEKERGKGARCGGKEEDRKRKLFNGSMRHIAGDL